MVRIKHRYLLINFLYPDTQTLKSRTSSSGTEELPWTVQFRKPSSDLLDARLVLKMIRDGISELFGDYGSGMVSGSLQVKYLSTATSTAIVRVARAHYRLVVRVSGTIKKSEEEAIRRARLSMMRAKQLEDSGRQEFGSTGADSSADADTNFSMIDGIEDVDEPDDADEIDDG